MTSLRHLRVGDGEVRQVRPHGGVDVDETLVDELHEHRRRPHLALRPDLEDGVRRRLDAGAEVGEPGRGGGDVAVVEHADGGAGDVVLARRVRPAEAGGQRAPSVDPETLVASRPPTWTLSIGPAALRTKYPFIPLPGPSVTM